MSSLYRFLAFKLECPPKTAKHRKRNEIKHLAL